MSREATRELACYYCGQPATSTEHVPPRCIFPERKDAFDVDQRRNLITVPSCDEHNLEKSKDDEFLMACITPVVGNNGAAFIQTRTKLHRAVNRSHGRLLDIVLSDRKSYDLVTPDGTKFPVLVGEPDMRRLCCVLEHIARGLFFHVTKQRFVGRCTVVPSYIWFQGNPGVEAIKQLANVLVRQERDNWAKRGDNPDIFCFQLGSADQFGLVPMVMTFFRGAEVYVAYQPEGVTLPFRTLSQTTPENPIRIDVHLDTDR
jgi:hypothetical protein